MNVLARVRQGGFGVSLDKRNCLVICGSLNDRQRMFISLHRWALIQALEAEQCQRNVIRYKFKHDGGGGVWITSTDPDEALMDLTEQFPSQEVDFVELISHGHG